MTENGKVDPEVTKALADKKARRSVGTPALVLKPEYAGRIAWGVGKSDPKESEGKP